MSNAREEAATTAGSWLKQFSADPVPLGAIRIDSPYKPDDVMANLMVRGKEWRESAIPESLKPFGVHKIAMQLRHYEFRIRWVGSISPFFNPVCYGTVEQTATGSHISAGFNLYTDDFWHALFVCVVYAIIWYIQSPADYDWAAVIALPFVIYGAFRNKVVEPMRSELIQILEQAAQRTPTHPRHPGLLQQLGDRMLTSD